eukprot:1443235-Amphidinium_carterae.1
MEAAQMRRTRQAERPTSSGRSRSARYVEEEQEVARMMKHAEDKGSFEDVTARKPSRQSERIARRERHASSFHRGDGRRSQEPPMARAVKLEEADRGEPLKIEEEASYLRCYSHRSHEENPERYARRIEHQQRERSPAAKPKKMP